MPVADSLTCPSCGQSILRTDSQCLGCGAHLDEGRLTATPTGQPAPAEAILDVVLEPEPLPQRPPDEPPLQRPPVPYRVDPRMPIWTQLNLPRGGGLGASLSRGWVFIERAVDMAGRDGVVVIPSLLATLLGLILISLSLLTVRFLTGGTADARYAPASGPALDAVFAVVGLIATLISFWSMGMTADLVSAVLHRRPATVAHAWAEACRNCLALLWLAVVTIFVNSLSRRVRHTAPILGDVVGDTIETGWRVASYLLVPIVILEDIPLSQAYGRAVQLHKNNVIGIIVGEIGISWITGFISTIVIMGALVGGFFAHQAMPALLPVLIASVIGLIVIMASAVAYIHIAYYTCLYEWAVATETAGEAVPAPAPLAAALGIA